MWRSIGSKLPRLMRAPGGVSSVVITTIVCATHAQPTFQEQSEAVGLDVVHDPSGLMATQWYMSGGIAVGDFNRDGHQDVFVISGDGQDHLFINDGTGQFTDEATDWGLTDLHAGIGASAGDYNNDGWLDLYVTSWGEVGEGAQPGEHRLYQNYNGQQFIEVAKDAGVEFSASTVGGGYGSAWGDYDLDGDLDLFVAHWYAFAGTNGNTLYRNNGDGTFTDVTNEALEYSGPVWGFQPVFADMNGDRYPDILLAADFQTSHYFINNGDETFTENTSASGLGLDDNGMGSTIGDFNNDGLLDWYVTSIHKDEPEPDDNSGNMLYINQGNNVFDELSEQASCNDGGWGWGTVAVDLDHDGRLDIVEVNGRPGSSWADEQAYLYHNVTSRGGSTMFEEIAVESGLEHYANQTSVVAFDADGDGDRDVISFANSEQLKYFENTTNAIGAWLRVQLDTSNHPLLAPDGFGTRLEATANGKTYVRYVDGRPSYLATGEIPAHFGLGEATTVEELRIEWSQGYDTILTDIAVNQTITVDAPPLGDVTGDGTVNVEDLLTLLAAWGPCPDGAQVCPADTNGDNKVDVNDLLTLLANWG